MYYRRATSNNKPFSWYRHSYQIGSFLNLPCIEKYHKELLRCKSVVRIIFVIIFEENQFDILKTQNENRKYNKKEIT